MKRGVIFDLDGTLIDSLPSIAEAVNRGLGALGLPRRSSGEVSGMIGEGVRVLAEKALPADVRHRADLRDALVGHIAAYYDAHLLDRTEVYRGIPEMLRALADAGVAMAVLSNKPDAFTQKTVDGLGLGEFFRFVLGQRDDIARKPAPDGARRLLAGLGLAPGDVLYVGDTAVDIETASAAGLDSAAVTWGFRSRDELEPSGPTHFVDSPEELTTLVLEPPRST